jgi:hypothetical protein
MSTASGFQVAHQSSKLGIFSCLASLLGHEIISAMPYFLVAELLLFVTAVACSFLLFVVVCWFALFVAIPNTLFWINTKLHPIIILYLCGLLPNTLFLFM